MARVNGDTQLPVFPWDSIQHEKNIAAAHPDGIVNLSVGDPVDRVDPIVQNVLAKSAWMPHYPQTTGTPELREAVVQSLCRRYDLYGLDAEAVLPLIGTKEFIASLPRLLGLYETAERPSQVVIPTLAYPTYEVGAMLAGSQILRTDDPIERVHGDVDLIYLNSPSNPTGEIASVERMQAMVNWGRSRQAVIASDECYLGLTWGAEAVSVLDQRVHEGDMTNILAIHSLSKTSNMASYRAGFVVGDPTLIHQLTQIRKHTGMMVPYPIQAAMIVALCDDEHENEQRERYRQRRNKLLAAIQARGFTVAHSEGGLYLWVKDGEDGKNGRELVSEFAQEFGILVAPGEFYGPAGHDWVRIAITATDERIDAAVQRLTQ